jgi:transposase InsO family protein
VAAIPVTPCAIQVGPAARDLHLRFVDEPPIPARQYTSIRFTETLALQGLSASIGTVSDAHDNAVAESFIGVFNNEMITAGYNNHRLHAHDTGSPSGDSAWNPGRFTTPRESTELGGVRFVSGDSPTLKEASLR